MVKNLGGSGAKIKMTDRLKNLSRFLSLLHKFQAIERQILVPGQNRLETDSEHSYQLAMVAWYLVTINNYDLDLDKVLKYALVHDLVEAYAGDQVFFAKNFNVEDKKNREAEAVKKIRTEVSDWPELVKHITSYEGKKDKEARFVYALDKLLPILNNYLDGGRTWKKFKLSLDQILDYKTDKIAVSAEVEEYFKELVCKLKTEEDHLFNN